MKNLKTSYDAIIIGGGHNGLVAAGYLALQGKNVAVFEARHTVGGCAVTEEPFSGFKFSSLSYVNSLFRPEIIRDLKLHSHGFEMLPRSPSSFPCFFKTFSFQ
jgi:phytoene dehydrogenase-like protein